MVVVTVSVAGLEEALLAKGDTAEIVLSRDATEPTLGESMLTLEPQARQDTLRFSGKLYDLLPRMIEHARAVGEERINFAFGAFPDSNQSYFGPLVAGYTVDFEDIVLYRDREIEVDGGAFTSLDPEIGPIRLVPHSTEMFDQMTGYTFRGSLRQRLDGSPEGVLILKKKDRVAAKEVHAELRKALECYHARQPVVARASTLATKEVLTSSKHREHLSYFRFSSS